jgi:parallel beta-helix repeat protein
MGLVALDVVVDETSVRASLIVDSGGGGDYTTIQAAVDAAASGETIYVKAGTYVENVVISTTLSLIGDGIGNTTINGTSWSQDAVRITADYVNITGFTVTGGGVFDNGAGIALIWTDYCRVYGNNISNNSEHGIHIRTSMSNTIENNTLDSNADTGIYVSSSSKWNIIANNSISNNKYGIYFRQASYNKVLNNTIFSNLEMDIGISVSPHETLMNNTMTGKGIYIWGDFLNQWNTHDIDTSNKINGKPVLYWKDKVGGDVPSNAGQVILANCRFINITNLDISFVYLAINLGYSSAINISDCTISDLFGYGIYFYESSWNTIDNIKIDGGQRYGFNLRESHRNTFTNCNVSNSLYNSAYIFLSNYIEFINNSFWRSYGGGLTFSDSDYGAVEDNFINLMNYTGVSLSQSDNLIVSNNTITRNNASGIRLYGAHNNMIIGNIATDNKVDGIHLEGSDYNTIDNNDFSRNLENGITLRWITAGPESDFNTISNNTIDSCKNGIYMGSVNDNIVEQNTVTYSTEFGFYMTGADSTTIRYNTFSYNSNSAIYTRQSSVDRIYENTVSYNYKGIEYLS